jgi:hypothetical protein
MSIGDVKTFVFDYGSLKLEINAIDLGDGKVRFEVKCLAGAADVNALYWGDGNATSNEGTMTWPAPGLDDTCLS